MAASLAPDALAGALTALRDSLAALRLDLRTPSADSARETRDELVAQVGDYLLPRLAHMDAPLLIVVGGSTGAGKSTLVNSLVGSVVTPAGVLRPTTRAPVLVCHPDEMGWFADERVLPALPRATGGEAGSRALRLEPAQALAPGLALLDAPDIDSVVEENRELAAQLLAAADAWLFLTTALRYADAVPWDFLRRARDRGTALSVVLGRVPADAFDEVVPHLQAMLAENGLAGVELLVVPESRLENGLLPAAALAPVRAWLDDLAADAEARSDVVRRTLEGALASVPRRAGAVAAAGDEQLAAAADLAAEADVAYARAGDEIEEALRSGTLLRGEVLARWYEVVGTGDLVRAVEARVRGARDRLVRLVTGRPEPVQEAAAAVETSLESVVRAAADGAAERAARAWRERADGRALLERSPDLRTSSPGFTAELEQEVRDWQAGVFELVRSEAGERRTAARIASLGVNGAGLTVMIAVFAHTGGLTGAEIAVAGGTSAVGQKVLEAIFGDQAIRSLAARARSDLLERVARLLAGEADRFRDALAPVAPAADRVAGVRDAVRALERAR